MTIKELHDYLYDEKTPRNPKLFIDTYEASIDLVNNVDLTKLTDYDYAMRLTCDYGILLEDTGFIKKGIQYLDKAKGLIENFPNYDKDKLFNIKYYESVNFHKARGLYNLKKYKDSFVVFQQLDKAFPNNDKYLSWINGIQNKKYERLVWTGVGIIMFTLIIDGFNKRTNPLISKLSFYILIFGIVFSATFEIIRRINIKKQKKNAV